MRDDPFGNKKTNVHSQDGQFLPENDSSYNAMQGPNGTVSPMDQGEVVSSAGQFQRLHQSPNNSLLGPNGTVSPVDQGEIVQPYITQSRRFKTGDTILKRYEVQEELGQGGMGVVYKCFDTLGKTVVAVKCLPPEVSHNHAEMEDVQENYTLVTKLGHPNIAACKTLEYDDDTGDYYLVMDYVEGENLHSWMRKKRREGKLTLETALPVLKQIAEALDTAHRLGVIHRDIKPDNVKIAADGTVKVLDFGLAAQIHSSMARLTNEAVAKAGTKLYMSPEQWEASLRQGEAADQYSLAVTAYEMLSGHVPFASDDMDVLKDAVLHGKRPPVKGLPKYANAALMTGLAKKAEDRYASCVDFVRELGGEKVKPKGKGCLWLLVTLLIVVNGIFIGYKYDTWKIMMARNQPTPKATDTASITTEQPEKKSIGAKEEQETGGEEESSSAGKIEKLVSVGGNTLTDSRQSEPEGYYIIKGELDVFNKEQFKSTWNREGTFGENMDSFKANYDGGIAAHNDMKYETAYKHFKTAKEKKDWLVNNLQPREDVLEARKTAEEARLKAEKHQPQIYAQEQWKTSEEKLNKAVASYNNGNFKDARNEFDDATKAFDETGRTALTAHIGMLVNRISDYIKTNDQNDLRKAHGIINELEKLSPEKAKECRKNIEEAERKWQVVEFIKAATTAMIDGNWQDALDKAEEALKKDPNNQEALTIRKEAENKLELEPKATIVATIDGQEVTAYLVYNGKRYNTPITYNLGNIKTLSGTLFYGKEGTEYIGEFNEVVNWTGKKTIMVELEMTKILSGEIHKNILKMFDLQEKALKFLEIGYYEDAIIECDKAEEIQKDILDKTEIDSETRRMIRLSLNTLHELKGDIFKGWGMKDVAQVKAAIADYNKVVKSKQPDSKLIHSEFADMVLPLINDALMKLCKARMLLKDIKEINETISYLEKQRIKYEALQGKQLRRDKPFFK